MESFAISELKNIMSIQNCHFSIQEPGWSYNLHHHYSYELLHCFEGKFTEWIHGESIEMAGGDWILISPNIKHSTINHSKNAFAYFSIHFLLEDVGLRNVLKSVNFIHIQDDENKLSPHFLNLRHLIMESSNNLTNFPSPSVKKNGLTPIQKINFQSIIHSILHEVLQISNLPGNNIYLNQRLLNVSEIDMAGLIENILNASITSNITIQEIAEQLFISRSHCIEVFKKVYGIAPRQYLSMLKLKKAKEMILHSGLSIETISEQLGFSCLSVFSRQFRRWTGLSPVQFRNKHHE